MSRADAAARFTASLTAILGFDRAFLLDGFLKYHPTSVEFNVFKKSIVSSLKIPTWSFFAEYIESEFDFRIPLGATKALVVTYALQPNPVAAFSEVAGCDEEKVRALLYGIRSDVTPAMITDIADCDCSQEFMDFHDYYKTKGPFKGKACIQTYIDQVNDPNGAFELTPTTLRALYWQCFGASELFTGNGFGWSGLVNPTNEVPVAAATYFQLTQSREYVVPAFELTRMHFNNGDYRTLAFPTIPDAKETAIGGEFNAEYYSFLEQGFFPLEPPMA